jgi:signal peptidase II
MGRRLGIAIAAMVLLLALDQASKAWVRVEVPMHRSTVLVPNLLELTRVENRGVSFSLLGDVRDTVRVPLLVGISLVAVVLLGVYWLRQRPLLHPLGDVAFVMILPGAVGNLIDRLVFGTVTDFLHFRFYSVSFFVNNVADILISLGVLAYLLGTLLTWRRDAAEHAA